MSRLARGAGGVALLALAVPAAAAQRVTFTIGPQLVLASYREVASGLRYQGTGFGGGVSARYRKLSAEAAVMRVTFDPAAGSAATAGFTATEVDAWVAYDVATYASVEAGFIRRTADPEFDAQSVGAVRIGARSFYEIGPGATVLFRADYLAAPKFSGGGHARFSIDLGLGLEVRLAGRLHGTAGYTFQRISRKTNPGGTGEIDAPIQETMARVGLAARF
jgi:opacity protein-like surface antigen